MNLTEVRTGLAHPAQNNKSMQHEQKDFIRPAVRSRRYVSAENCIDTSFSILCKGKKRAEDLLGAFDPVSRDYLLCVATINGITDAIASLARIKESMRQQKEIIKQSRK